MPKRPRIMLDFDGVLLPTYEMIALWHDENFDTNFHPFDPSRWADHTLKDLWGPDAPLTGPVFDKSGFAFLAETIEGVKAGVKELAAIADLAILSSGYDWVRPFKTKWARRQLPEISEAYYLESGESKAGICLLEGASLIIEDRYDYALDCAKVGIPAIVLDRYQWGAGPEHQLIHHSPTWAEIPAIARKILTAG